MEISLVAYVPICRGGKAKRRRLDAGGDILVQLADAGPVKADGLQRVAALLSPRLEVQPEHGVV